MKPAQIFQEVLDNSIGILISFDDHGNVIYLNVDAINETGFNSNQVKIHQIFSQVFDEDDDFREIVIRRRGEYINTIAYRSNFTCFPVMIRLGRLEFDDGTKVNLVSAISLYNENEAKLILEKTENDIQEIIKERNEFVANITHELRTPVNGIKGHIKNLMLQDITPEQQKTLKIVERCCDNMEIIINNLLDFSKLESGKTTLDEHEFDIRQCIEHVINTSISIANEKGIKLSAYVAQEVPVKVIGDEVKLIQILNNLVSNAVKFTSIGYVRLEVYKTLQLNNSEIELSFLVIDSGIGISDEEQKKLFKSFSQVDGSITRQYGGTGLGLYICQKLVGMMRGKIKVQSEKGKGSTFQFSIVIKSTGVSQGLQTANIFDTQEKETVDEILRFGSEKNSIELRNNFEKMIICIEMNEWEKAENFADNIKKLTQEGTDELKKLVFRLQMSIRKEEREKSLSFYQEIMNFLQGD